MTGSLKGLLEQQREKDRMESELNKGSTFKIYIPNSQETTAKT